jgi:hypothetical protein
MAGTTILDTVAVGSRAGLRRQTGATTTTKRYDVHAGNMDYLYSENRTTGFLHEDLVQTEIAIIDVKGGRREFDVRSCAPHEGERVRVLTHRIGFTTVVDLYQDRFSMIVARGDQDLGPPNRTIALIVAIAVGLVAAWCGRETLYAFGYGSVAGIAVFVIANLRRSYIDKGLAVLRWRAERRLKRITRKETTR